MKLSYEDNPKIPASSFRKGTILLAAGLTDAFKMIETKPAEALRIAEITSQEVTGFLPRRFREEECAPGTKWPWGPEFCRLRLKQERGHLESTKRAIAAKMTKPGPMGEMVTTFVRTIDIVLTDIDAAYRKAPALRDEQESMIPAVDVPDGDDDAQRGETYEDLMSK